MSILRVLRVLRLVKLVRLIRASRLVDRWKSKVTLTYGAQTVLQCVFMLLCASHWYACIFALQAGLHEEVDQTWLGAQLYDLCDTGAPLEAAVPEGSPPLPACPHLSIGSWYLASLSWAVLVITGCGGTDYYPSRASDTETAMVTALVLFGAFICSHAAGSKPGLAAHAHCGRRSLPPWVSAAAAKVCVSHESPVRALSRGKGRWSSRSSATSPPTPIQPSPPSASRSTALTCSSQSTPCESAWPRSNPGLATRSAGSRRLEAP